MMFAGMTEADGFAIAMMVMLSFALGSILIILIRIARNASKHRDDVDELMDEARKEPVAPSGKKDQATREPWEKEADWWKK